MSITLLSEHEAFNAGSVSRESLTELSRFIESEYRVEIQEVTVVFMTDVEHTELNISYLSHDYSTDILTFDLSNDDAIVGDVCINGDVCIANAGEYGVSVEEEMWRLIVHGLLHLAGLDDATEEEKKEMRAAEDRALEVLNAKGFM